MSEIEFLTMCMRERQEKRISKPVVVVYAGAAPGTHISLLLDFFPGIRLELYDPRDFNSECYRHSDSIRVNSKIFDNDQARYMKTKYTGCDLLFICDVRSTSPNEKNNKEKIRMDMHKQMHWHILMRPRKSILKFRLPYTDKQDDPREVTLYLKGHVKLPVWGPLSTTECRLIADKDARLVEYNNKRVENQMFYFNTVTRYEVWDIPKELEDIYVPFYDDAAEIEILEQYFRVIHGLRDDDEIMENIRTAHKTITEEIGRKWVGPEMMDRLPRQP